MTLIDADVFLEYLIFSKHIDSLKCGEVKEAIEMSKVDVLDKIRAEISADLSNAEKDSKRTQDDIDCGICIGLQMALDTISWYKKESEEQI